MEALLKAIASGLVEKPEEIVVTSEEQENGTTVYHLHVAEDDMGRVIGKQGRSAKAIRVVMRAAATRNDKKIICLLYTSARENSQKHRAVFRKPRRDKGQKAAAVTRAAEAPPQSREPHQGRGYRQARAHSPPTKAPRTILQGPARSCSTCCVHHSRKKSTYRLTITNTSA